MGMGGRPGRPRPARDAHQPLLVRRNYLLCPRDIAFPDEVDEVTCLAYLRVRVLCQPTLRPLGMAVSSHNPKPGYLSLPLSCGLSLLVLFISSLSFILASIGFIGGWLHLSLLGLLS